MPNSAVSSAACIAASFPPGDHHRRLRRIGAIKKFGTPVSEFTATGGDAGAGGGSRRCCVILSAVPLTSDAPRPTSRYPFIGGHLRWPPARGRGLKRVVAGRAGGGGCGNEKIGCPNLMHY
jgi:hypothetical protein